MPPALPVAATSLLVGGLISASLLGVAIYLFLREGWLRDRRRGTELTPAERRFYTRQYVRRLIGSILMALLAAGFLAASAFAEAGNQFLEMVAWLAVLVLLLLMFFVAAADVFAIRRMVRDQTRRLVQEHQQLLHAERTARLQQTAQSEKSRVRGGNGDGQPDA